MSQKVGKNNNKVYRLVLTGGPCGGKTTGQARLCTFFENLGWKVYRVPETARVLLGGGVKWADLSEQEAFTFQEDLIKTMLQIEETFFDLAAGCSQNCVVVSDRGIMDATALFNFQENLIKTMMQIEETFFDLASASPLNTLVVCDRGIMDASAYNMIPADDPATESVRASADMKPGQWDEMKAKNSWNDVEMRDNRYNQVIHMVSAAKGAEAFYQTDTHIRHENLDLARQLDNFASQSWVGHPYYDIIDNSTDFEAKVVRMIAAVCNRLGIDAGDRLSIDSRKRKFLVACLPSEISYPQFQDFIVVHDYLVTPNSKMQARIRRRGQNVKWNPETQRWNLETGNWTYTHTIRRPKINNERPELKMQISSREYELLLAQRDTTRHTIYKKRRCFLWNNQYYQMDIYQEPCHPRCAGMIILETYTTQRGSELQLPDFLEVVREVTEDSNYSMYNLSQKVDAIPAKAKPSSDKHAVTTEQKVSAIDSNKLKEKLNGASHNDVISNGLE